MKTVKFNTRWITAAVLATGFASANVMAHHTGGLSVHNNRSKELTNEKS